MDCALRLRERHKIQPEQIVQIRCRTAEDLSPPWSPSRPSTSRPNGYAAKFSLPYCSRSSSSRSRAGLAEFTDEAARDEAVLQVASRVSYEIDRASITRDSSSANVTIRLDDGRLLEERQDRPRGGPDLPMTWEEIEAKFRGNATLAISEERASRIVEAVARLDRLERLAPLMESLTA